MLTNAWSRGLLLAEYTGSDVGMCAVNENVLRSHKLQRRLKYTNL
jgi:hypothetical protein